MYGYTPPPIPIVRPRKKRRWIILYCCAMLIAASVFAIGLMATLKTNQSHATQSTQQKVASSQSRIADVASSPTSTPTSIPTPAKPAAQLAPTEPPPTPTPTTPSYHPCTAQNCDNPWGFVLGCSCGNMWQPVSIAPAGFCNWFHCASEFNAEQGDIGECGDGQFVHNGECSGHDGLLADLYVNVPPTATP